MMYNFIKVKTDARVCYLTLSREEKRNAFTPTMVNEIAHAIDQINRSKQIALVVLQAEGPVFCAGMDLKTYQDPSLDVLNPKLENKRLSLGEVMDRLERPSLALVKGPVIAGGFLFLLSCTYVFVEKGVTFRLPEVDLGLFPFQVFPGLCRLMSERKALQLCLDSRPFDSEKALAYGLIDGYIEEKKMTELIQLFSDRNAEMLASAMTARKAIRGMETAEQYDYLLQRLEELKKHPEVQQRLAKAMKKR